MACKIIMPALGVAQQTGTLLKWLKAEGQTVTQGEPLMEVETDKSTVEIDAAASGILAGVVARAGDVIPVGQTIAVILDPGEALPSNHAFAGVDRQLPHTAPRQVAGESLAASANDASPTRVAAPTAERVLASPNAKRMARQRGIELAALSGSGPEGAVLTLDVLRAASANAPALQAALLPAGGDIIPFTPMRRLIGERMAESKQRAPHFYLSMDIDMSAVIKLRNQWQRPENPAGPSITDFIVYAVAHGLKHFPAMNSSFTEQGIEHHADINIGVAVALQEGLVVPVLRNADRLSLPALAQRSRALADQAQSKRLLPAACQGGTFTVSNLGMLGVDSFIAIINPPQCAILAIGRVAPRVVTDGDGIEIRPLMTATLSADHRLVDGANAARFLQHIKQKLETAGADLIQSHEPSEDPK